MNFLTIDEIQIQEWLVSLSKPIPCTWKQDFETCVPVCLQLFCILYIWSPHPSLPLSFPLPTNLLVGLQWSLGQHIRHHYNKVYLRDPPILYLFLVHGLNYYQYIVNRNFFFFFGMIRNFGGHHYSSSRSKWRLDPRCWKGIFSSVLLYVIYWVSAWS